MALFQQSVLKKYINDINKENLQSAWLLFQSHFHNATIQHNILHAKEEEYQEGFVRDLFVTVLGYTLKPQPGFNLVMEQKSTSDATKSDGAILSATGTVSGVIELKDTNTTDLDKVARQAFGYKHQHKDCVYIITANFEKLRFYINDAIDFEEFDLFRLSKERFAVLYCCLQQQALHNDVPLRMKQQSLAEEENITKKLYADYSRFKKLLFANITNNNPQYNQLELFKKTQKLLDRFLFILFAEDRLLLPPNSVREILQKWEQLKELDNYVPLYDRFKKYFGYLNTGYQGKQYEIFAYNGGLFAPDDLLDNIIIEDQLLYDSTKTLSNYDFESEVDVNILGHIFEHSLNEIEEVEKELTAAIQLKEAENTGADSSQEIKLSETVSSAPISTGDGLGVRTTSKRKKDGVFYTPRYITKYIVENTLGTLCSQQKEAMQIVDADFAPQKRKANTKQLQQKLDEYRQWLLQLTICDPACGSGAFLNQALEFLIAEHKSIDELTGKLFGDALVLSDVEASILENNLYGVDINDEATEIAKLSLWLRTARKGRKLNNLNQHIKCGNSLIDDPAVAGDKAFNWQEQFPQVFAKGGFDVVIGNPPYVRAESFLDIKVHLSANYKVFDGNADLYSYFFEKGISLIKRNGLFSVITPNKWIQSNYGFELRKFISHFEILEIIDFGELPIFEDAGTFPSIMAIRNSSDIGDFKYREILRFDEAKELSLIKNSTIINQKLLDNNNWILKNETITNLIKRLETEFSTLGKVFGNKFLAGIKTGANGLFIYSFEDVKKITNNDTREFSLFKQILFGQDFGKYLVNQNELAYLFFPYKYLEGKNTLLDLSEYPNTNRFFEPLKNELSKRAIIKEGIIKNTHKWYELQQLNKFFNYDNSKIIYPDIAKENRFILDKSGLIPDMTCFFIPSENLEFLPLLNSSFFKFLASNYCPILGNIKTGGRIRYKSTYLAKIPFPLIKANEILSFRQVADIMLSKNKELQQIKQQLLQLLQGKYPQLVLTKKLQDWPGIAFKDFVKELDKQKIKLTLPEQSEWMQYVATEKAKANAIQQLIAQTDKTIDAMVYELYQLSPEEIQIVESNA